MTRGASVSLPVKDRLGVLGLLPLSSEADGRPTSSQGPAGHQGGFYRRIKQVHLGDSTAGGKAHVDHTQAGRGSGPESVEVRSKSLTLVSEQQNGPDTPDKNAYRLGQPEVGLRSGDPLEGASAYQGPDSGGKEVAALGCRHFPHEPPVACHLEKVSEPAKPYTWQRKAEDRMRSLAPDSRTPL